MTQTQIKTYRGCIIRFDNFDNYFCAIVNNESIRDKDIEKLQDKIYRITKAKQQKIPAYGRITFNSIEYGEVLITSVNRITNKVYYTITQDGKNIKKQDSIGWAQLYKKDDINKAKVDKINEKTAQIRQLEQERSNLISEMEEINLKQIAEEMGI